MNKTLFILILGLAWLLLAGTMFAKGPADPQSVSFNKPGQVEGIQTMSNLSNWAYWLRNDGQSAHNFLTDQSGGFYPRGTAAAIYEDGFIWGGVVRESHWEQTTGSYRVGGQTYRVGTSPGAVVQNGTTTSAPIAADANTSYIYRIRRDYQDLAVGQPTVINDAADIFNVSSASVTEEQQSDVIEGYQWAWDNWPTDLGAPYYDLDGNGAYDPGVDEPGIADADQVIYFVINDLNSGRTVGLYGSQPVGMECRITVWSYNQPGATLGQVMFKKYQFTNKSGFPVDSVFIAQWSDPDIGQYTDDLVGCDSIRSVGYCYNGNLTDSDYDAFQKPPPASGYDFFQGPIVEGAPEDTAIFGLEKRPGYRNLPLTSFGYFASGSTIGDPDLGEYAGTLQWYNLLNGFTTTDDTLAPTPFTHGFGPKAGQDTKFPVNGNPVTSEGDLDAFGTNLPPGDRRMSLSSGPFFMPPWVDNNSNGQPDFGEPGVQEVVVAVLGGIVDKAGGNNRNAVAQLLLNDDFAQFIFDNLFRGIPTPPASPDVVATPLEDKVTLEWGSNSTRVADTEAMDELLGFHFEGYNIYQYSSENKTDPTKVATIDIDNTITTIKAFQFVPEFADIIEVPIQRGFNSGITRSFVIDRDYIRGGPLYAGNKYYFAVTAYNAKDKDGDGIVDTDVPEPSLESAAEVIIVTPQSTTPGMRYEGEVGDVLEVDAAESTSDGVIQAMVVDPSATTGDTYDIYFTEFMNPDTTIELRWNVRNSDGDVIIENQRQAASVDATDIDRPIVDGIEWVVTGPALDFKNFLVTSNAAGPLDPPDQGCFAFNNNGFPFFEGSDRPDGDRQQTNGSTWGINHNTPTDPDYADFVPRITGYTGGFGEPEDATGLLFLIPRDYEIRFTESGGRALFRWPYVDHGTEFMGDVPFELWCIGDPNNPDDDYQCVPWINDEDSSGTFSLLAVDHDVSGGANDPYTDGIYWLEPIDQTQAGFEALLAAHEADPGGASGEVLWAYKTDYAPWFSIAGMMRMVIVNWNGGDVTDPTFPANVDAVMPETGTTFLIGTTKPNQTTDVFKVTAPAVTQSDAEAQADVEKINVFPNPYYAYNPEETSRFNRFVTFTHLPEKATIRIFTISGVLVRKIEHDSESQFEQWNLRNEADLPVASGMYITHIDMPDPINKEKVLKVFIVQGDEILEFF